MQPFTEKKPRVTRSCNISYIDEGRIYATFTEKNRVSQGRVTYGTLMKEEATY